MPQCSCCGRTGCLNCVSPPASGDWNRTAYALFLGDNYIEFPYVPPNNLDFYTPDWIDGGAQFEYRTLDSRVNLHPTGVRDTPLTGGFVSPFSRWQNATGTFLPLLPGPVGTYFEAVFKPDLYNSEDYYQDTTKKARWKLYWTYPSGQSYISGGSGVATLEFYEKDDFLLSFTCDAASGVWRINANSGLFSYPNFNECCNFYPKCVVPSCSHIPFPRVRFGSGTQPDIQQVVIVGNQNTFQQFRGTADELYQDFTDNFLPHRSIRSEGLVSTHYIYEREDASYYYFGVTASSTGSIPTPYYRSEISLTKPIINGYREIQHIYQSGTCISEFVKLDEYMLAYVPCGTANNRCCGGCYGLDFKAYVTNKIFPSFVAHPHNRLFQVNLSGLEDQTLPNCSSCADTSPKFAAGICPQLNRLYNLTFELSDLGQNYFYNTRFKDTQTVAIYNQCGGGGTFASGTLTASLKFNRVEIERYSLDPLAHLSIVGSLDSRTYTIQSDIYDSAAVSPVDTLLNQGQFTGLDYASGNCPTVICKGAAVWSFQEIIT